MSLRIIVEAGFGMNMSRMVIVPVIVLAFGVVFDVDVDELLITFHGAT